MHLVVHDMPHPRTHPLHLQLLLYYMPPWISHPTTCTHTHHLHHPNTSHCIIEHNTQYYTLPHTPHSTSTIPNCTNHTTHHATSNTPQHIITTHHSNPSHTKHTNINYLNAVHLGLTQSWVKIANVEIQEYLILVLSYGIRILT